MDANRFDGLARSLAGTRSRRGVVKGLVGGAAAVGGAALGRVPVEAAPKPKTCKVGCSGFNRQAKTACEKACKECGNNFDRVCTEDGPFGPTAFVCCAEGTFCVFGEGICCPDDAAVCFDDQGNATCVDCGPGEFPDPNQGCACVPFPTCEAEAPENCAAGVFVDCDPDGFCACVENVDGGKACVERACTFEPCTTGADCSNGPCIIIPDCCDGSAGFCGVPCGNAGAGARSAGGGWQR
jgi:hypothetical protein